MTPNNNLNVLPFYSSTDQQDRVKKDYSFGQSFDLICHSSFLLPFQIIHGTYPGASVLGVHLINANTGERTDISTEIIPLIDSLDFSSLGYNIYSYPAKLPIPFTIKEGKYYLWILDTSGLSTFSEVFTVVNDVSNFLKIEYWDSSNFIVNNGQIDYTFPYRNFLYLDTQLAKPDYPIEETLEKRGGFDFIEIQISSKLFKFQFLAPEYLLDAMRIIRLHDHIRITNLGDLYDCSTFLITPKWTDRGYLATVDAEFTTGTVIKKLGKAIPYTEMGDFNNDYSNDYNN